MQIVNPLRAALPYITLQTAKVQHRWADYFIFSRVCGGRRPFRLRRNTQAKPASATAGGWACGPRPEFFASPKKPDKKSAYPIANYTYMVYYIAVIKSREHFPAVLYTIKEVYHCGKALCLRR